MNTPPPPKHRYNLRSKMKEPTRVRETQQQDDSFPPDDDPLWIIFVNKLLDPAPEPRVLPKDNPTKEMIDHIKKQRWCVRLTNLMISGYGQAVKVHNMISSSNPSRHTTSGANDVTEVEVHFCDIAATILPWGGMLDMTQEEYHSTSADYWVGTVPLSPVLDEFPQDSRPRKRRNTDNKMMRLKRYSDPNQVNGLTFCEQYGLPNTDLPQDWGVWQCVDEWLHECHGVHETQRRWQRCG